jgi:hypothetical protein
VQHTEATQWTYEELPKGAAVEITISGTNDAGEGPAGDPIAVVVK